MSFSEESFVGANVLTRGISCAEYSSVPFHIVSLKSSLVSGPVKNGIQLFEGVHLFLGNGLAGDKIVVNAIVTEKPCLEKSPDPVEKEILSLYPACAVTRAMTKKKENSEDEIILADTVIGQVLEDKSIKSSDSEPVEVVAEGSLSNKADKMSTCQLIAKQHKGLELSSLFTKFVDENEVSQNPVCLFTKNGVLMRKWRPRDVSIEDELIVKYQIVVPKSYRQEIVSMAHETPSLAIWASPKPVRRFLTILLTHSEKRRGISQIMSCLSDHTKSPTTAHTSSPRTF